MKQDLRRIVASALALLLAGPGMAASKARWLEARKEAVATEFGLLEVTADHAGHALLRLEGKRVEGVDPQADSLSLSDQFWVGEQQLVLLYQGTGDKACPGRFALVELGYPAKLSKVFGNCSRRYRLSIARDHLDIDLPRPAARSVDRYRWTRDGVQEVKPQ